MPSFCAGGVFWRGDAGGLSAATRERRAMKLIRIRIGTRLPLINDFAEWHSAVRVRTASGTGCERSRAGAERAASVCMMAQTQYLHQRGIGYNQGFPVDILQAP